MQALSIAPPSMSSTMKSTSLTAVHPIEVDAAVDAVQRHAAGRDVDERHRVVRRFVEMNDVAAEVDRDRLGRRVEEDVLAAFREERERVATLQQPAAAIEKPGHLVLVR